MLYTKEKASGFSIIEMSIVLVIIGLMLAGSIWGRSLLVQFKLKKITKDLQTYETAITTFNKAYLGLPGDIINAGSFWPSCDGTPANCNGNGDGFITNVPSGSQVEAFRAWQQLAAAELISGTFSGTGTMGGGQGKAVIGTNVPASPIDGVGYSFDSYSNTGNNIFIGSETGGTHPLWGGGFTTSHAYSIDTKLDDGVPGTGKIRAMDSRGSAGTSNGTCIASSAYQLTNTSERQCMVYYKLEKRGT
ncbi:MAG: prepilin-type N-terminal cleavage/methylation protein [Rickettsiales bacterium]|jgi:prepilin-type N-terminal cleavage/methylation domain-containing protein|nr:prepilin-type N-terminal cleavage/methylation protein [Rickettsiales bacterium]